MKNYLSYSVNPDDFNLVSVTDELSLWAAPFGMRLLDKIRLKENMNVLDIGSGLGFPLIEIAQRLGMSGKVFGIDPWKRATERTSLKINTHGLKNVMAVRGVAETLPFKDNDFNLVVSNNGLNNVGDISLSFSECSRVCKSNAQFVFTLNLDDTMIEFYKIFMDILSNSGMYACLNRLKNHIYEKRKPLHEVKDLINASGFKINEVITDEFKLKFLNAEAMFNHSLIKYWFLDSWKKIPDPNDLDFVFNGLEDELNKQARANGFISLSIPFVVIDSTKI